MVSMTVTKASFRLANSKSIASSEILNILHAAMYVEWQFFGDKTCLQNCNVNIMCIKWPFILMLINSLATMALLQKTCRQDILCYKVK